MSLQEELAAVRRRLDHLARTVDRLEQRLAREPEDHVPPQSAGATRGLVTIPDTPYDSTLWTDSDDEGLGLSDRRAP